MIPTNSSTCKIASVTALLLAATGVTAALSAVQRSAVGGSGRPEAARRAAPGAAQAAGAAPSKAQRERLARAFGKLPLTFEANAGQVDRRVKFVTRGPGYSLFLTPTEAVLSIRKPNPAAPADPKAAVAAAAADEHTVVRMKMVGANPAPAVSGEQKQPGVSNYFRGIDRSQWRANVPHYGRVRYDEVYPGVDVVYYGNQRELEYDFVVAPGADPDDIQLQFQGADRMEVERGDLVLHTAAGELRQRKPYVYQEIGGTRRAVEGKYVLGSEGRVV